MKRSPKTQLRFVAVLLLITAVGMILGVLYVLRPYHQIFDRPWWKSFVSEVDYNFYKHVFGEIAFMFFPFMAGFHIWAAWNILLCAKKLAETPQTADTK